MRFCSLGSGSKGNALLVAHEKTVIMIDCGFSLQETTLRMARCGIQPEQLDAVLVTHEHGDHVRGVKPLAKKYRIPVYSTQGTYQAGKLQTITAWQPLSFETTCMLGTLQVTSVAVPHDAKEPCQFIVQADDRKLGVLTDLGSVSAHVQSQYRKCHALYMEANYDDHMLQTGPYPPRLKARIASDWGHLSNQQATAFLAGSMWDDLQTVVIAHSSQENNSPSILDACFNPFAKQLTHMVYAHQDYGFEWLTV